ncbi:MAG: diadenylate cyclase CdaA [Clostridiales bacterium]|nr:diadenylate cyclase CdaA [Clostridiales bacterium]
MKNIIEYLNFRFRISNFSLPISFGLIDIIQILLIAIFVYYLMVWVKNTRAYMLLKGVLLVVIFLIVAALSHMDTILWICKQLSVVAITGVIVIFQPELRRALEQLGEKKMLATLIPFETGKSAEERISDRTIGELIHAVYAMGEVKTGALIVIEQNIILKEYEKTGIAMDSMISSQLLINIFEHNTPLHDGAVIVRNNRIVAATCYLPLSDNLELNKSLGTRHRAGVGISEVSDALTIIVSEETGKISYTMGGKIHTGVNPGTLREELNKLKMKSGSKEDSGKFKRWKGRGRHEEKTD